MKILLVSATSAEIAPLITLMGSDWEHTEGPVFTNRGHELTVLITGVGMVATTYALTKALQNNRFDLALQAGIAGCFDRQIPLGEVVNVVSDQFGDLGAEDHYNFLDVFDLGLETDNNGIFQNRRLINPNSLLNGELALREVKGLTVATVTGSAFTMEARIRKYGAQLESMEGAAFHYTCLKEGIPFLQVRAISNYVEPRDRSRWKIPEALKNLNAWLAKWLEGLA